MGKLKINIRNNFCNLTEKENRRNEFDYNKNNKLKKKRINMKGNYEKVIKKDLISEIIIKTVNNVCVKNDK